MSTFLDWFQEHSGQILKTFYSLHAMPEPGFEEFRTSGYIAASLESWGWEVQRGFAGTAVLGRRTGAAPGPTVCLRADMDALSFTIDGELTYIHACGHDANMAQVLAVAQAAAECGFPERGTFLVLFQPCEEGMKGALAVAASGVLKDVDFLLGTHLRPAAELRSGACPAIIHGSMTCAKLTVHGKAAHGARPREGVNAVTVGASIVVKAAQIRREDKIPFSVKATRFSTAPGSVNIIPAEASIIFDMRAQTNRCMEELKQMLETIAEETTREFGASFDLEYTGGVPAAEVSEEVMLAAAEAIRQVYGEEGYHDPAVTPGGEDFHFYTREIPGINAAVLGFGADMQNGLHNPHMTFDHSMLPTAAKTLAATVSILLDQRK